MAENTNSGGLWTRESAGIEDLVFRYEPPQYASQCVDVEHARTTFRSWYFTAEPYMSELHRTMAGGLIEQAKHLGDVRDMVDLIAEVYRQFLEQRMKEAA